MVNVVNVVNVCMSMSSYFMLFFDETDGDQASLENAAPEAACG